eukprot:scaffold1081_cov112-Isochrysis_galbana.AAC.7
MGAACGCRGRGVFANRCEWRVASPWAWVMGGGMEKREEEEGTVAQGRGSSARIQRRRNPLSPLKTDYSPALGRPSHARIPCAEPLREGSEDVFVFADADA